MKASTVNLVPAQSHVQAATSTEESDAIITANESVLAGIVKRNVKDQTVVTEQAAKRVARDSKAKAKREEMARKASLYGAGVVRKALDARLTAENTKVSAQSIATDALRAFVESGAKDIESNGFVAVADALYADPALRDKDGKAGRDSECKRQYMVLANMLARASTALSSGDDAIMDEGTRYAFNSKGDVRSLVLKGVKASRENQPETFLRQYRAATKEHDSNATPDTKLAYSEALRLLCASLEVLAYEQTGEHVAIGIKAVTVTKKDTGGK